MLYIFYQYEDGSGEGVRATWLKFTSREACDAAYNRLADRHDMIAVTVIEGTEEKSWPGVKQMTGLSDDILAVSNLEDVDGLEEKEGI